MAQLEAQAPWWPSRTAFAYRPITIGTVLGELLRRVTAETLGRWFARHVAEPLGLDFWIGLPAYLDERVVAPVWAGGLDRGRRSSAARRQNRATRMRLAGGRRRSLPPMNPDPRDPAPLRAYDGIGAAGFARSRDAGPHGGLDRVRLHADLTILAKLACAQSSASRSARVLEQSALIRRALELLVHVCSARYGTTLSLRSITMPARPRRHRPNHDGDDDRNDKKDDLHAPTVLP